MFQLGDIEIEKDRYRYIKRRPEKNESMLSIVDTLRKQLHREQHLFLGTTRDMDQYDQESNLGTQIVNAKGDWLGATNLETENIIIQDEYEDADLTQLDDDAEAIMTSDDSIRN